MEKFDSNDCSEWTKINISEEGSFTFKKYSWKLKGQEFIEKKEGIKELSRWRSMIYYTDYIYIIPLKVRIINKSNASFEFLNQLEKELTRGSSIKRQCNNNVWPTDNYAECKNIAYRGEEINMWYQFQQAQPSLITNFNWITRKQWMQAQENKVTVNSQTE